MTTPTCCPTTAKDSPTGCTGRWSAGSRQGRRSAKAGPTRSSAGRPTSARPRAGPDQRPRGASRADVFVFATAARTKPDAPAQLGGAGTARPKLRLQRKCAPCASGTGHACPACEEEDEKQAIELQRKPLGEAAPALGPTSLGVLVDDDQPVGPGQMSRSIFMAALRAELAAVCDRELAAAGRSSRACPYLSYWMAYYERRPAAQIERAVRLYTGVHTPEPATLLAAVVSRVQVAVRRWALTGEVTGVPAAAVLGGLRGETGERASSPPVQTKSILSEGSGPSGVPSSPVAVQAQLGGGQALDAGVRGRMERGFGTSLSRVRIHT